MHDTALYKNVASPRDITEQTSLCCHGVNIQLLKSSYMILPNIAAISKSDQLIKFSEQSICVYFPVYIHFITGNPIAS